MLHLQYGGGSPIKTGTISLDHRSNSFQSAEVAPSRLTLSSQGEWRRRRQNGGTYISILKGQMTLIVLRNCLHVIEQFPVKLTKKNIDARVKTVELVVDKTAWRPKARIFADNDLVPVRIGYAEKDLIESAKAAKGRWNPDARLWSIRYGKIKGTALEKHIALDALPNK